MIHIQEKAVPYGRMSTNKSRRIEEREKPPFGNNHSNKYFMRRMLKLVGETWMETSHLHSFKIFFPQNITNGKI